MKRKKQISALMIAVLFLSMVGQSVINSGSIALADETTSTAAPELTSTPIIEATPAAESTPVPTPTETPVVTESPSPTPIPTPVVPVTGISTQYTLKSIYADKVVSNKTDLKVSETYELWVGDKMTLTVTVKPDTASDKTINYVSSNTNVATVSAKGVVTVKGMGDTTITISSLTNPEISQSFNIHCYKNKINVITDMGAVPDDGQSDLTPIKKALTQGQYMLPGDTLSITIPEGTYDIEGSLPAYSNTTLTLAENTIIKRAATAGSKVMLKSHTFEEIGGYGQIENFTMSGGVWDGNADGSATSDLLYFGHGKNITISDTKVMNTCGEHLIEFAGIDSSTIKNVKLENFIVPDVGTAYTPKKEAIQLDYCSSSSAPAMKPGDYTPSQNITITGCSISNYMCGIGAHGYSPDTYLDGININNNTFTDITNVCIDAMNFTNLNVENNTVNGFNEFVFAYLSDGTIKNNTVKNRTFTGLIKKPLNTSNGIELLDSSFTITANTLDGQLANGIYVGTDSEAVVTKNKIKNSKKYAIYTNNATATYKKNTLSSAQKGAFHTDKDSTITFSDDIRAYYVALEKEYPYTGKKIKPVDAIPGLKKKYYKITYKNNKKKGTATVIIKGKSKVKKTNKLTFKIV